MKTYIFKVKLKHDKRIWRKIEVLGSHTLDELHMAIQEAFDFDADPTHLYSFFMSRKAWDRHFEYCHPDADGHPATTVKIESLNLKPKQKFLYLFDYGDEWKFEVEFLKEGTLEKAVYPRIINSKGKAQIMNKKARMVEFHRQKTSQTPKRRKTSHTERV